MAKLKPDYIEWVLTLNASDAQQEIHKLSESNKELKNSNKAITKSITELIATGQAGGKEWENLNAKLKENNKVIGENNKKIAECEGRLDKTTMSASQLARKASSLRKELRDTVRSLEPDKYAALEKELKEVEKAYAGATQKTESFSSSLFSLNKVKTMLAGVFVTIGAMITGQIVNGFGEAVQTIISFEKRNSVLAGVLGTSKKLIQDLTDEARRLGSTTSFTAAQVTELQIELAKLGFFKEDIIAMTPYVLNFAKAVDTDLASAASLAGATLRMFNIDADDAERAVAAMTMGCNSSALSFEYLNTAMAIAGPVANSFGFTIEDTTALLGALSNSGFDASMSATATRNILLNLADSSGKLALALGTPVNNLDDLVKGLNKLKNEGIDLNKALELTDQRSVAAFNTFLNSPETVLALRDAVTDAGQAFNDMADEMGDNIQGSLNRLSSTIEGVVLNFYETKEALRTFIDIVTLMVESVSYIINMFFKWKIVTYTVTTAIVFYYGALKIAVLWKVKYKEATILAMVAEKRLAIQYWLSRAATLSYAAAKAFLTGNIIRCAEAIRLMRVELFKNPYTAFIALVMAAVVAMYQYKQKLNEARDAQKNLSKMESEVAASIQSEKDQIKDLTKAIHDTNLNVDDRRKYILKLQELVPDYHASITEEGKLYDENTDAIKRYLKAKENEMKMNSLKSIMQPLYDERAKLEVEKNELQKEIAELDKKLKKRPGSTGLMTKGARISIQIADIDDELADVDKKIAPYRKKMEEWQLESIKTVQNGTNRNAESTVKQYSLIKKLEDQKQKVQETWKEDTKENIKNKNQEIERIDTEIQKLKELGKVKKKVAPGEYKKTETDSVLKPLEVEHQKRMLVIKQNREKENKSESQYILDETNEQITYYRERIDALKKLESQTPAHKKKLLDEIHKLETEAQAEILTHSGKQEDARIKQVQEKRDDRLKIETAYYHTQKDTMEKNLLNHTITEESHNAYMLQVEAAHSATLVSIHRTYFNEVNALQITGERKRADTVSQAANDVRETEMQLLRDRAAIAVKVRELTSQPIGASGMKEAHRREVADVEKTYNAIIEIARQSGLSTVDLERQKKQEIIRLNYEYQNSVFQIQTELGTSWAQEHQNELAQLQNLHNLELISEKEFQRKKLKLQMNNAEKYFNYFSGLSSSMVDAIQQAEIDQVDAKYEVLIQHAKNNGEDTAELEEEKENKKLEIQKKYADVNFAIKCSQIIADTAVSIMKANADLGPIAGPIAAVMLAATGAAQLMSAKAERDKIKNMSVKSTSSNQPTTAERVVGGYSEGGYTGMGERYEVAGVVHKGEYVVPQPEMNNPKVIDAVSTIEAIRRQRTTINALPESGYAEGGYTDPLSANTDLSEFMSSIRELRMACEAIKQIKAYIVYQDFEKSKALIETARNTFTRG